MSDDINKVVLPYKPRWFQREIHNNLKRFNILVMHRRAGKTVLAINELIKQIMSCPHPNPRGHYIAPFYSQVKRIAWQYVKEYSEPIPDMRYNESELRAIFPNGAEIQLLGAEKYHSHRGIYSDYVVMDEPAQMHPAVWGEIFRPALADRQGGAIWIGTPCGHNSFYDRYQKADTLDDWYRGMYKVTETGALARAEIIAASEEMTPEEFEQEFMCSWSAAIRGAYYGRQIEQMERDKKIINVPHEPELPVITSWDLGIRDSTVIHYWQIAGREVRMIDCSAFTSTGLPEMIKHVSQKPYNYSQHIAPHDIRVRELGSGKSRLDIAASLGLSFDIAPQLHVQDGIQSTRNLLKRCVIDKTKCSDSLEALRQYRTEYDDKRQIFSDKPLHDWTSDYADSIRYFAISTHNTQTSLWDDSLDYSSDNRTVI